MHFNLAGLWILVIFPLNLEAAAPPALPARFDTADAGLGAGGTLGSPPQHPWGDMGTTRLMSLPRGSLVLSRATTQGHRLCPPLNAEGLRPAPTAPSRGSGPPRVAQSPQGQPTAPDPCVAVPRAAGIEPLSPGCPPATLPCCLSAPLAKQRSEMLDLS